MKAPRLSIRLILPLLAITLLSAGCNSPERYAANQAETTGWLKANTGPSRVNVSGNWHSDEWGTGYLTQTGNRVLGYFDDYTVTGVINDRTLTIVLAQDGWTYYSAVLESRSPTRLEGGYSRGVPFDPASQYPFILQKLNY